MFFKDQGRWNDSKILFNHQQYILWKNLRWLILSQVFDYSRQKSEEFMLWKNIIKTKNNYDDERVDHAFSISALVEIAFKFKIKVEMASGIWKYSKGMHEIWLVSNSAV